ncbi:MAG: deoxyribose-phosphate aldolase [Eubacteriales bacterium]|nr:deoxyribose-phosphate aldolase [Eubacteriales bacterium]
MNLAKMIDHTILKADATEAAVRKLCAEAREYGFASVCVNTCHTQLVAAELAGSDVLTCSVVGFPLGAMSTAGKVAETRASVADGAQEIDMVINVGAIKDGRWDFVTADILAVVEAAKPAAVKVILETCLLTDEEKIRACQACVFAQAAFVKTSTGFSTGGATLTDVALMKKTVAGNALVKASGGVRTAADAQAMIEAGADRIGTSNGIAIVQG